MQIVKNNTYFLKAVILQFSIFKLDTKKINHI